MKHYIEFVRTLLAEMGYIGKYDPRHIIGYMLLVHSTLDALSKRQFIEEIKICIGCIKLDGIENAERNAKSYAL